MEPLPNNWADIQPDTVYQNTSDLLISFSQEQIKLGIKYDQNSKHLTRRQRGTGNREQ
jgi:hypothetical protein